jgi:hypothetical protein
VLRLVLESVAQYAPDLVFPDPRALEEILEEPTKFNLQHSVRHYQASGAHG